jgi:hypothetical protein
MFNFLDALQGTTQTADEVQVRVMLRLLVVAAP